VSGAIVSAVPVAGLLSAIGVGAGSNTVAGVTERLIASGGKDAGTLKDAVMDAGS
jgi:hypothetical protein